MVRLMRDRRGVSAVEFALIVPLLILLYVGIAEIGNALTIYRRTASVASTAADLTAQVKQVTASDLKDIESASTSIMTPADPTPLKIVLSSVVADEDNNGKVDWSCASKGSGRTKDSSYALPAGLTQPDSSVIVAEITYDFTPLVGLYDFIPPFEMKRTFYARPRRSLTVKKIDGAGC